MSSRSRRNSHQTYHLDAGVSSGRGGCLRAFLKGGNGHSASSRKGPVGGSFPCDDNDSYLYTTDGASSIGSHCKASSQYNSRYGLLEKNGNTMAVNDSFQTERTGRSDLSYGEKSQRSTRSYSNQRERNGHNMENHGKNKVRNRVASVMTCGIKTASSSGTKGRTQDKISKVDDYDDSDAISFSQRSQAGLLDYQHSSSLSISRNGRNLSAPTRSTMSSSSIDARSWKTTKSSSASYSTGASDSRHNSYHHSETNPYDYAYPSDIRETGAFPSFESSFETAAEEIHENMELQKKGSVSDVLKGCVQIKKRKENGMIRNGYHGGHDVDGDHNMINNVPTHMPHIPEGTQFPKFNTSIVTDDENFPQIIFANDEGQKKRNDFGTPTKGGSGSDTYPNIQPFSSYEKQPRNHNSQSSPRRRHPSPIKSPREFKHEEQFLDTLANTLTTNYNTLQANVHQLTGKAEFQRLMEQAQHQSANIPDEVDFVIDDSDLVSEFGMQSTSGGRLGDPVTVNVPDNGNNVRGEKSDYGPIRKTKQGGRPPPPPPPRKQSSNQYNPHQLYKINDEYDNSPRQNQDEHFQCLDGTSRRRPDMTDLPRRSLFNNDECRKEQHQEHSGSTYDIDGPTPLALAEAFEDFGMDDRLYSNHSKQSSQFDSEGGTNDHNGGSNHGHYHQQLHPASFRSSPSKTMLGSIEGLPSPTKVGLSTRHKKYDSSGEWREDRRAMSLEKNKEVFNRDDKDYKDSASEVATAVSQMTRRSDKYRDIMIDGLPQNVGKTLDRQQSGGSTQTQQWSNTRTARQQTRQISRLTPVDDEESRAAPSDSGQSYTYEAPRKALARPSPHSIQDYNHWQ